MPPVLRVQFVSLVCTCLLVCLCSEEGAQRPVLDTEVFIRVASTDDAGVPARFWAHDKFTDRLYMMREMYQLFVENGRSLECVYGRGGLIASRYVPHTPSPSPLCVGSGSPYLDNDNNPFVDPPEDALVGRATVYLDPIMYLMPVDEWIPIIDYKGTHDGELHVRLVPHLTEEPPEVRRCGLALLCVSVRLCVCASVRLCGCASVHLRGCVGVCVCVCVPAPVCLCV